jgi:hypothetical protein
MVKGQSWSMDLIVGVVIFGLIAIVVFNIVLIKQKPSVDELRDDAVTINTKLEQSVGGCGTIVEGQSVTPEKLQCLYGMNYSQLKQELGIEGDFCIYVEDANGKLYIVNNNTNNKTGFGDPALIVSGTPCGQPIAP